VVGGVWVRLATAGRHQLGLHAGVTRQRAHRLRAGQAEPPLYAAVLRLSVCPVQVTRPDEAERRPLC
jgi:hypothetical protein